MSAKRMDRWEVVLLSCVLFATLLWAGRKLLHRRSLVGSVAAMQSRGTYSPRTGGPQLSGCPIFPADNIWNTEIDRLPKDKHSDAYIDSIGPAHKVHPDFGG